MLSEPVCAQCHIPGPPVHWRYVSPAAAHLHDLLYGDGCWLAPPNGYVLPVCAQCASAVSDENDGRMRSDDDAHRR